MKDRSHVLLRPNKKKIFKIVDPVPYHGKHVSQARILGVPTLNVLHTQDIDFS